VVGNFPFHYLSISFLFLLFIYLLSNCLSLHCWSFGLINTKTFVASFLKIIEGRFSESSWSKLFS
jgi:hypothetical protein